VERVLEQLECDGGDQRARGECQQRGGDPARGDAQTPIAAPSGSATDAISAKRTASPI
jgi:hypothetical protein